MHMLKLFLLRSVVILIALLVAWRLLVSGLGEHYTRQARLGDEAAVDLALLWNPLQPEALYLKALRLKDKMPDKAMLLLQQSIAADPADAVPVQALAELLLKQQQAEKADQLMAWSVQRMPANKGVRLNAANYWARRQNLAKAMANWAAALELDHGLGAKIFPTLMLIAENSELIGLFKPLAEQPPSWWNDFFTYVSRNTRDLNTLIQLASIREASDVELSVQERDLLTQRLAQSGHWAEAYLVWSNGLSDEERSYLGSVFDGGFELPASNKGFGWHFPENRAWTIRRKHTYGSEGQEALHILYKGENAPVEQVYQPMLLPPARYRVNFMSRVDRLHTQGGLRWVVRCAGDLNRVLGTGPLLVGASDWETQQFIIDVPNDPVCSSQLLRLEISSGSAAESQPIDGEVWFDRFSIRKI